VSLPWATGHIAAGCLGGLLVAFVGTAVRRRDAYAPNGDATSL